MDGEMMTPQQMTRCHVITATTCRTGHHWAQGANWCCSGYCVEPRPGQPIHNLRKRETKDFPGKLATTTHNPAHAAPALVRGWGWGWAELLGLNTCSRLQPGSWQCSAQHRCGAGVAPSAPDVVTLNVIGALLLQLLLNAGL